MNNNLIFFCIATAILIFSVIAINLAPVINGLVGKGYYNTDGDEEESSWSSYSCNFYSHNIKDMEDYPKDYSFINDDAKDKRIKALKNERTRCNRKQAMAGLEYVVFNLNMILGFICALLGFLQYLDIKKIEITGIIGLGCGVVGFVLTLVYVIESGLVFTDYVENGDLRVDKDSAILKWDGSKQNYICIFYKEDDPNSCTIRYSDYGNKYLNYRKEIAFLRRENDWELKGCTSNLLNMGISYSTCKMLNEKKTSSTKIKYYDDIGNEKGECDKIYNYDTVYTNGKKILYDHWVATIIFSCFILLFNIGIAIFGFLLFNSSGQAKI